jgi:hypothetical protein
LLRRQAGRKLAEQCQETVLIVFHAKSVSTQREFRTLFAGFFPNHCNAAK